MPVENVFPLKHWGWSLNHIVWGDHCFLNIKTLAEKNQVLDIRKERAAHLLNDQFVFHIKVCVISC